MDHPKACPFGKNVKKHWFYRFLDALTEAMLDHPKACPKAKNERRAAWERSGAKRNERHAAWERFLRFHGPCWPPRCAPPETPQTVYLKRFKVLFWSDWRRRRIEVAHLTWRQTFIFLVFCTRRWRQTCLRTSLAPRPEDAPRTRCGSIS